MKLAAPPGGYGRFHLVEIGVASGRAVACTRPCSSRDFRYRCRRYSSGSYRCHSIRLRSRQLCCLASAGCVSRVAGGGRRDLELVPLDLLGIQQVVVAVLLVASGGEVFADVVSCIGTVDGAPRERQLHRGDENIRLPVFVHDVVIRRICHFDHLLSRLRVKGSHGESIDFV